MGGGGGYCSRESLIGTFLRIVVNTGQDVFRKGLTYFGFNRINDETQKKTGEKVKRRMNICFLSSSV